MAFEQTIAAFRKLVSDQTSSAITSGGLGLAHALFPNDFEYYLLAFELVDERGALVDRLIFPVMPDSITKNDPHIVSVRKTMGGVVSTANYGFSPKTITLQGTFGRKFKLLIDCKIQEDAFDLKHPQFSFEVKTGYGCMKLLEAILNKSRVLTPTGQPYRLIFYNLSFNDIFYVEVIDKNFTQSLSRNMIWEYNIQLRAVAPTGQSQADVLRSMINFAALGTVNKQANQLLTDSQRILNISAAEALGNF